MCRRRRDSRGGGLQGRRKHLGGSGCSALHRGGLRVGWGWAKMCLGVDVGRVCPQRRPCLNTSMDIPQRAGPAVAGRKREVGLDSFSLVRVVFALSFPASPPLHPQSQHFLAHPNLCLLSPPEVTAGLGASSRSWGVSGGGKTLVPFLRSCFSPRGIYLPVL